MREPRDARIFFALWPVDGVRAALDRRRRALPIGGQGRQVPASNLHLTLHFVGKVRREEMDCMRGAARRVTGGAFELDIDDWGWFRRPRVGWLGPAVTPAPLAALHDALGRALGDCGYRPEARPFHPHVTVARKLTGKPAPGSCRPVCWPVEDFVLVESVTADGGVQYRVVEHYPLK